MAAKQKTIQRIVIWVITLTMTIGSLGAYFLIILQTKNPTNPTPQPTAQFPVDPTAYKVEGKVNQLQTTDEKVGDGQEVKAGDSIKVHYKGTFAQTGQKFDSSYDRGEPVDLTLADGEVISGWVKGIPGMKVGGKRRLVIPSDLAYGAQGNSTIPPNTDMVFEVELVGINPKQ